MLLYLLPNQQQQESERKDFHSLPVQLGICNRSSTYIKQWIEGHFGSYKFHYHAVQKEHQKITNDENIFKLFIQSNII